MNHGCCQLWRLLFLLLHLFVPPNDTSQCILSTQHVVQHSEYKRNTKFITENATIGLQLTGSVILSWQVRQTTTHGNSGGGQGSWKLYYWINHWQTREQVDSASNVQGVFNKVETAVVDWLYILSRWWNKEGFMAGPMAYLHTVAGETCRWDWISGWKQYFVWW